MMERIRFAGRETSRIGLGCGRLVGGAGLDASRQVVEEALDLGIRHFDVAPSYGLGLAEDALGALLEGVGDVTIATKVGIGRPGNAKLKALARQLLRPLVKSAPALKAALGRSGGGGAPSGQFAPDDVQHSLADSLRRLRRDRIDALLLHEPVAADLSAALADRLASFIGDGRVAAVGSGTGADSAGLVPFGTVRQYRFGPRPDEESGDVLLHGVLRAFAASIEDGPGRAAFLSVMDRNLDDPESWPGSLLTLALACRPDAMLLVSSTSATRLRAAVRGIDWSLTRDRAALSRRLVPLGPTFAPATYLSGTADF